jgi:glyoxylase-like metal-dependent hydrolase (beta-lactamase superfamily II)
MTRRDLLKFAGAGSALAFLPSLRAQRTAEPNRAGSDLLTPAAPPAPRPNSATYRFRVGDIEAVCFSGGIWKVDKPHGLFASQASDEQFHESLAGEGVSEQDFRVYFNILLLRTGRENILLDTGYGEGQPEPFKLQANLAEIGLKLGDITQVYLSHAHGDHMGGILGPDGKPVFRNAEHLVSAPELDFWTSAKPDFSGSGLDAASQKGMVERARALFDSVRFTALKEDTRTPEGLRPLLAPGHTPGHLNFLIESKGERIHHIVDLAHHFAVMMPHPEWTVAFDTNAAQAVATRRAIFARLAAEGTPVFGYHLPFPALGRLVSQGSGYRWLPRQWDPCT